MLYIYIYIYYIYIYIYNIYIYIAYRQKLSQEGEVLRFLTKNSYVLIP